MAHNSPPNGARESKIPLFDSESKTTSNCILRFFSKKTDLPTLFSFYHYWNFVNKAGKQTNLIKIFSIFRKINLKLTIVNLYWPKNKALRSQNHSPKVKNDSCSTYAKMHRYVNWLIINSVSNALSRKPTKV